MQNIIAPVKPDVNPNEIKRSRVDAFRIFLVYFLFVTILAVVFYLIDYDSPDRVIWFGLLNALFPSIYLSNIGFLSSNFTSEKARRLTIDLIVFIPVVAYYTGKYQSELVYQNLEYKYTTKVISVNNTPRKTSSDTLKFIGHTESSFVFTDLKNSKTLYIKSDNIDTLILYDKKITTANTVFR